MHQQLTRKKSLVFYYLFEESQIDLSGVVIRDAEIVFDRLVTFFVSLAVHTNNQTNKRQRQYFHE